MLAIKSSLFFVSLITSDFFLLCHLYACIWLDGVSQSAASLHSCKVCSLSWMNGQGVLDIISLSNNRTSMVILRNVDSALFTSCFLDSPCYCSGHRAGRRSGLSAPRLNQGHPRSCLQCSRRSKRDVLRRPSLPPPLFVVVTVPTSLLVHTSVIRPHGGCQVSLMCGR